MNIDDRQGDDSSPRHTSDRRKKAEIIFREFLARRKSGELVEPEQYIFWYPELQNEFRVLMKELDAEGLVNEPEVQEQLKEMDEEVPPQQPAPDGEPDAPGNESDPAPDSLTEEDLLEESSSAPEQEAASSDSSVEFMLVPGSEPAAEPHSAPAMEKEPAPKESPDMILASELKKALQAAPSTPPVCPSMSVDAAVGEGPGEARTGSPSTGSAPDVDTAVACTPSPDRQSEPAAAPGIVLAPAVELALQAAPATPPKPAKEADRAPEPDLQNDRAVPAAEPASATQTATVSGPVHVAEPELERPPERELEKPAQQAEERKPRADAGQTPVSRTDTAFSDSNRIKDRFPPREVKPAAQTSVPAVKRERQREKKKRPEKNMTLFVIVGVALAGLVGALAWYAVSTTMAKNEAAAQWQQASRDRETFKNALSGLEKSNADLSAALARSEGLRFAVQSASVIPENPGTALLLAVESARRSPGPVADRALLAALKECHERRTLVHQGIAAAALSPDARKVATGSSDATALIRNGSTGEEITRLRGHEEKIQAVDFSPDGERVVTGSADGTAGIWDGSSGEEFHSLGGHGGGVTAVRFSPDGWRVVTGSADATVRIWDAEIGVEIVALEGHERGITDARFGPDGKSLATSSFDGTARTWDALTGTAQVQIVGHEGAVTTVDFSSDGSLVVTASVDGTARIWERESGELRIVFRGHGGPVRSALFSPDDRLVLTVCDDGLVRLFDAAEGSETAVLKGHEGPVLTADFSADGESVLTSSADGTARIWDVVSAVASDADDYSTGNLLDVAKDRMPRELTLQEKKKYSVWKPGEAQAAEIVEALFEELTFTIDVTARLESDRSLTDLVRDRAICFVRERPDDPGHLDRAAWEIVKSPGCPAASCSTAIRYAEAACSLDPGNGFYLNTLGIAQYRAGRHAQALTTLLESDRINSEEVEGGVPHDVAFIAMAHHRLGQAAEAQAALERVRTMMEAPDWAANERSRPYLEEAEALIDNSGQDEASIERERVEIPKDDQAESGGE